MYEEKIGALEDQVEQRNLFTKQVLKRLKELEKENTVLKEKLKKLEGITPTEANEGSVSTTTTGRQRQTSERHNGGKKQRNHTRRPYLSNSKRTVQTFIRKMKPRSNKIQPLMNPVIVKPRIHWL